MARSVESNVAMTIVIAPYDERWPKLAEAAITELRAALPGKVRAAEHIGSTAVPGLAAKAIIDVMAAVDDLAEVDDAALAALGYDRIETCMSRRLLYHRAHGQQHNVHIVELATWETRKERIMRDHLRTHPDDARLYADAKRRLAASGLSGDDYGRAKTEIIQRIMDRAHDERGLPHEPVWEE
jgi:GrpB-like predicted nucleotidyltransferase (UPF0157 family)